MEPVIMLIVVGVGILFVFLASYFKKHSEEKEKQKQEQRSEYLASDEYQQLIQKSQKDHEEALEALRKQATDLIGYSFTRVEIPSNSATWKSYLVRTTLEGVEYLVEYSYREPHSKPVVGKFDISYPIWEDKGAVSSGRRIKISDILFWSEKGSVQYSSKVSGGGSAGLNTRGAIGGALFAGTAGAIVGATLGSGTAPVKTETVTHDSREIIVRMVNGSQESFNYRDYDAFMRLLAEKEYTFLQMSGKLS